MQNDPQIIIVIVNYNGTTDTIDCLKSILNSSVSTYLIIVVDNQSDKEKYLDLLAYSKNYNNIKLLQAPVNGGFAYGNNIGIKYGMLHYPKCSLYWLKNNDTKIFPDTIKQLLNYANHCSKSVGIMGNKMLFYDHPEIIQAVGGKFNRYTCRCSHIGAYKKNNQHYNINADYVVGASMLVRKEFVDAVGLMCEDYFLYFEELDWIERGKKLNWRFSIDETNAILHKEGGSTNSRKKLSIRISTIQLRSRILFMKRYYPKYLPFAILSMIAMIFKYLVKGEFKMAKALLNTLLNTTIYEN